MSYEITKENVFLEFHSLILKATNSAKSTSSSEIGRPIYTYLVSARTQRRKLSMTSHACHVVYYCRRWIPVYARPSYVSHKKSAILYLWVLQAIEDIFLSSYSFIFVA